MRKCNENEQNKIDERVWIQGSDNVFKDLGFSDEEAVNLLVRTDLMIQLREIIKAKGWSQRQAAREIDVAQPRIAEIMGMRIDCFSIDLLIKYLDKLGQRVKLVVEPKEEVA